MRYAFYISGSSGRLVKFLRQADAEAVHLIKLVISDRKLMPDIQEELENKRIAYKVLEYQNIDKVSNREKNLFLSDYILEQLHNFSVDYCFSFGAHILSGELLVEYKWRLINFHPAILPMYPGRRAVDQAVEHGNTFLVGNTAHFIDSGVDTGKIIMQSVIPLDAFYESDNDYNIVLDLQIEMLNQLISIIEDNRLLVQNSKVRIKGADYSKGSIFPQIIGGG